MEKGTVQAYYGYGRGKTSAAIGCAIHEVGNGGSSIIIQFLKGKGEGGSDYFRRLEPEIRIFCFQKYDELYDDLSDEKKREARASFMNGLNYARKVMNTAECSMLVLDEVLGLVDKKIIPPEELIRFIEAKPAGLSLLLTGRVLNDALLPYIDSAYQIQAVKEG